MKELRRIRTKSCARTFLRQHILTAPLSQSPASHSRLRFAEKLPLPLCLHPSLPLSCSLFVRPIDRHLESCNLSPTEKNVPLYSRAREMVVLEQSGVVSPREHRALEGNVKIKITNEPYEARWLQWKLHRLSWRGKKCLKSLELLFFNNRWKRLPPARAAQWSGSFCGSLKYNTLLGATEKLEFSSLILDGCSLFVWMTILNGYL